MEGVKRYKVRLLEHNPMWKEEFNQVKTELKDCLKDNALIIEHVGSTAISSIKAKPILDVAVLVESIDRLNIQGMEALGYDYRGSRKENGKYHLFVLRAENTDSLRHIHCYEKGEKEFEQQIGFRDYLNTHPKEARRYEILKEKLAAQYPEDRASYTKSKEKFILEILRKIEE